MHDWMLAEWDVLSSDLFDVRCGREVHHESHDVFDREDFFRVHGWKYLCV